ncbi:MAG: type II toxin-antitoxin system RelE/ParE family toxin [Deltaproteobacteria bacterium]|nr:type II toxin-antitoxin system RelE/ParE family toxin [Deltaproteobacteria bacterium]
MADYKILVSKRAERGLDRITDNNILKRIVRKIDQLANNPRPSGVRKIMGSDIDYRIRMGDYRVIFQINDAQKVLEIRGIGHRKEIYKKL